MTFKRSVVAVVFVLALLAGCGKSDKKSSDTTKAADDSPTTNAVAVAGNAVQIKGFAFGPPALKVSAGTKVTWTNKDSTDHTATAPKGKPFDSGHLGTGKSFSYTFDKAGTYSYFCDIHNYMKGTVEVS